MVKEKVILDKKSFIICYIAYSKKAEETLVGVWDVKKKRSFSS